MIQILLFNTLISQQMTSEQAMQQLRSFTNRASSHPYARPELFEFSNDPLSISNVGGTLHAKNDQFLIYFENTSRRWKSIYHQNRLYRQRAAAMQNVEKLPVVKLEAIARHVLSYDIPAPYSPRFIDTTNRNFGGTTEFAFILQQGEYEVDAATGSTIELDQWSGIPVASSARSLDWDLAPDPRYVAPVINAQTGYARALQTAAANSPLSEAVIFESCFVASIPNFSTVPNAMEPVHRDNQARGRTMIFYRVTFFSRYPSGDNFQKVYVDAATGRSIAIIDQHFEEASSSMNAVAKPAFQSDSLSVVGRKGNTLLHKITSSSPAKGRKFKSVFLVDAKKGAFSGLWYSSERKLKISDDWYVVTANTAVRALNELEEGKKFKDVK